MNTQLMASTMTNTLHLHTQPAVQTSEAKVVSSVSKCGLLQVTDDENLQQEAQLPQRNSASAAHMEGANPSSPLPLPALATPMRMAESESHNVRMSSVPSVKRALR